MLCFFMQLKQAVEKIASKERHINKEFDHLGGEFREHQKKHDTIQEVSSLCLRLNFCLYAGV